MKFTRKKTFRVKERGSVLNNGEYKNPKLFLPTLENANADGKTEHDNWDLGICDMGDREKVLKQSLLREWIRQREPI